MGGRSHTPSHGGTPSLLTSRLFVDVVTTFNRFKAPRSGSHVYKVNGRGWWGEREMVASGSRRDATVLVDVGGDELR